MASCRAKCLLVMVLVTFAGADDIDNIGNDSMVMKALREMSNQTQADTLNLPANASSIRENITDTFSCENRTYGYYADVENDCQLFHVCLPSQTPSGRNVTYRWSFICPNETIFNQEVLTCTRPIDSIDCADSPMFYHLNMEIGKVPNKTEEAEEKRNHKKIQKRRPEKKRENIVVGNDINDIVHDEFKEQLQQVEFVKNGAEAPMLIEAVIENVEPETEDLDADQEETKEEEIDRIVMERNMRDARQIRRGSFRFRSDV